MKVGTDGVLLGAWVRIGPTVRRILDIGTGTGVIALMLAQRTQDRPDVLITGIDVGDVAEARTNADASPWADRVHTLQCPVQRFDPPERYDLIVSNPPFFVDSLPSPDAGRTRVRHATELPFRDLHDAIVRLLAPNGRFSLILPPSEAALFLRECRALRVVRCTGVRSTPRRGVRRVLLELVRGDADGTEARDCPHPPIWERSHSVASSELPASTAALSSMPEVAEMSAAPMLVAEREVSVRSAWSPPTAALDAASSSAESVSYVPVERKGGATAPLPTCGSVLSFGSMQRIGRTPSSDPYFRPEEACEADTLTIGTGIPEEYTEEYRALTRDFYLKF